MLEKMTPNQRLMLAVAISFVFFFAYTAIFPPEAKVAENNVTTDAVTLKQDQVSSAGSTQSPAPSQVNVGHEVRSDETVAKSISNTLVSIESAAFTLEIDTLGRISSKIMKDPKFFNKDGEPSQMVPDFGAKPLFVRFADEQINEAASKTPYRADIRTATLEEGAPVKITLTQELPQLTVQKKLTFYSNGHYDVDIALTDDTRYFIYLGSRPQVSDQMMTVRGGLAYTGDGQTHIFEDGDVEGRTTLNDVKLVSAFDQYYASIFYGINPDTNVYIERDRDDNPISYIDGSRSIAYHGYIGPKDYKVLKEGDPVLVNAIEYGWFTFAAAPLFTVLMWLENIFGNWGWAIVALTIIIRIFLYPLTYKGMVSMQKMKDLAPKMKELQAKYKGDPQRMNAAVMELYKKHGANPLGGCLPLLLQIPVFFAIYRLLLNAVELQGAGWILWIDDLSRLDPYFVLPILMGATMYYQQKITPSNFTDPMQEKIFKFLPIIFTFFFITFPSGLVLYWFVNNLFSIGQQYIVNRKFEAAKDARHEKHLAEKSHGKN